MRRSGIGRCRKRSQHSLRRASADRWHTSPLGFCRPEPGKRSRPVRCRFERRAGSGSIPRPGLRHVFRSRAAGYPRALLFRQCRSGQALAINEDGTLNSSDNPAQANSVMVLYATRRRPDFFCPSRTAGSAVSASAAPTCSTSDGRDAGGQPSVICRKRSRQCSGFLQINIVVPPAVIPGVSQSVVLKVGSQKQPGRSDPGHPVILRSDSRSPALVSGT